MCKPRTFFRLTPDADELCLFAVKRGNIRKRFDVRFNVPKKNVESVIGKVKLGSLCLQEPDYGASAAAIERTDESQPKYIRITDFSDNGIEENHIFMTATGYTDKHRLMKGDILFARSGATVGKTYYYDGTIGEAVFAGYCIRFKIDERKVLSEYVYWYTKCSYYLNWANSIQRPSGQPNINKEEYKSLEIMLPSRDKQRCLVDFMNTAAQKRREKLRQADELLTGLSNFMYTELGINLPQVNFKLCYAVKQNQIRKRFDPYANQPKFTEYFNLINKHFRTKKLSEISDVIFSGITPKSGGDAYTDENVGIPFIRSGNIANDITTADVTDVYIKSEIHSQIMGNSQLKYGDILIAIVGATIGKVGIYKDTREANINQAIAVVRLNSNFFINDFVMIYLQSPMGQMYLDYLKRPVARANINLEEIGSIEIPLVSEEIQQRIISLVNNVKKESNEKKLEAETEWSATKVRFEQELLGGTNK